MKVFSELKRNLKKDLSVFPVIKVALLGDTATQFLHQALRATGYDYQFNLEIFEADFNQVERQVFDPSSELYEFAPDLVIIFQSTHKLLGKYSKLKPGLYSSLAETQMEQIDRLNNEIRSKSAAKIIYYNYPEINDSVFGSYANKTEQSFLFQLRKLNYELMVYAAQQKGFYICDLSSIQNQLGKTAMFQPSVYVNTEMVLSFDCLPEIGARTLDVIAALYGKFKKCLIIDLDNTMWGGIIGDDGIENIQVGMLGIGKAFTEFQYWAKKLKNRGIILAVCSKNTDSIAREPFEKHPEMVLKLDDIAVFVANWETKVENIKLIQRTLNIGYDSMVFVDDNPFERNMVREALPAVTVPELPVDPADYIEYLYSLNLFETASFSDEDAQRTKQYQTEAQRVTEQSSFASEDDFLQSLNMLSVVEPFNKFNTPRVSQLSQRSNQFNLRTVRYTEADIEALTSQENAHTLSFTLEDKFGDNGLISIIILSKENADTLFIDTWLMSCRVLKRGMENFVLNTIVAKAREAGAKFVKGEYIPTAKNAMVKDHYKDLGFTESGDTWILDVDKYENRKSHIQTK